MMLRTSTAAEKYFHFPNRCHGYEDIHIEKEKTGFFPKHDLFTTNLDKSSEQLLNCNSRHCLRGELESSYSDKYNSRPIIVFLYLKLMN